MPRKKHEPFGGLPAFDGESGNLNAVIETPKGSRNKFKYNGDLGIFELSGILPAGANFPFDFGFVPSTTGGDGDPLDVLLLMDAPAFAGCLVPARLIGVIEADQTERDGKRERNDRLIAVAIDSNEHKDVKTLDEVSDNLLKEIEHFFVSYNSLKGKKFKPLGRYGPDRANKLVQQGVKMFGKSATDSRKGSGTSASRARSAAKKK